MGEPIIIDMTYRNAMVNRRELMLLFQLRDQVDPKIKFPEIDTHRDTLQKPGSILDAVFLVEEGGIKTIIKTALYDEIGFNRVINECFIGYFGLNQLNSKNFAKIIGFQVTGCPEAELDFNRYRGKTCVYAMYEHVEGPTFYKYLNSRGFEDVPRILMDIFNALYAASELVDFTHYDLHLENIIIQEGTPVIIDYGLSHIKYQGYDYGRLRPQYGTYNKNLWYADVLGLILILSEYLYNRYPKTDFGLIFMEYQRYTDDILTFELMKSKLKRNEYMRGLESHTALYLTLRLMASFFFGTYDMDCSEYLDMYDTRLTEEMLLYGYNFKEFLNYIMQI